MRGPPEPRPLHPQGRCGPQGHIFPGCRPRRARETGRFPPTAQGSPKARGSAPSILDQVPSEHPGPRHWTVQAPIFRRTRGTGLSAQSPRGLSLALPGTLGGSPTPQPHPTAPGSRLRGALRPEQPRSSSRPPSHRAWSSHQPGDPHAPRGPCLPEAPLDTVSLPASLGCVGVTLPTGPPGHCLRRAHPQGLTPPAVSSPRSTNF